MKGPKHLEPWLPRAELLHYIGASHQQLVVDYFWIRMIHAAGVAFSADEYRDLYYYANLITDLDPNFYSPYKLAGVMVPTNLGRERWLNTDLSTRILEKGLSVYFRALDLKILLAYNLSYFHKDYKRAAALVADAAQTPGAPAYLGPLATRLYAQGEDFDAGLALAQSMAHGAGDPETRTKFEKRVKEIQLERELVKVEKAWRVFREREGRAPNGIPELVSKGDLKDMPWEPFGGRIFVDQDGVASSTSQERRLRIYEYLKPEEKVNN